MGVDLKNKKFLKEWDKIKDSDVFSSLESFAEFYYANGEKKCFRINTNEPWSKDNFFFGEYSDLLVYYKEEQPKKRIGQKFHSLTIMEVFWQEDKGKKELFAKCKCDCGNETIKKVDAMVKGNARTCGCNRGRRESTAPKKIKPISQELIDELWDFEKNDVDPQTIACDSTQKYWWKNNHGVSFELEPFVFIKPDTQTSFPEQAIFFYLKEHFNDAINKARYITQYGEIVEIDIYIPSLNVGIEYDGLFWHKDKLDIDEAKNQALNNDGIYVIRVREEGLPSLSDNYGSTIFRILPLQSNKTLVLAINSIFQLINEKSSVKVKKISLGEFESVIYEIYALIYNSYVINNIKSSNLSTFWDYDKNDPISPANISVKNSKIPFHFKCSKGFALYAPPKSIVPDSDKGLHILCPLSAACTLKDRKIKCEKFAQDLILREAYLGKNYNASRYYRVCYYLNDEIFLSFACNKNSTLFLNKNKFEDVLEFICLCSMDYHNKETQLRAFRFVYNELSNQHEINAAHFFKTIIEQISLTETPKILENSNICQLIVKTYGIDYLIKKILKPQLNNFSFRLFSAACNFVLASRYLSNHDLDEAYNILKSQLTKEVFEAFCKEVHNATTFYIDSNILAVEESIRINELFGAPLSSVVDEGARYKGLKDDLVSKETYSPVFKKSEFVDNNKCQHCGGSFKKKYILLGDYICVKCGKKKDY